MSNNLADANYIASFLGISLNALYLRMHFDNFPKALKINGKLFFDLNAVISHIQSPKEDKAFAFLVQDEIRSLIDLGRYSRSDIGSVISASNPKVAGGAIYLRPISMDRASVLKQTLESKGVKFDISDTISYYEQQSERLEYIALVWEQICGLIDEGKIKTIELSRWVNPKADKRVGDGFYKYGPSYKIAKILKLRALQKDLL